MEIRQLARSIGAAGAGGPALARSALGGKEAVPDVHVTDHEWDDMMLLCTDGLTKHVSDDEIRDIMLGTPTAEGTCRTLVELALERGGSDNVSVVVGRLRPRGRTSKESQSPA